MKKRKGRKKIPMIRGMQEGLNVFPRSGCYYSPPMDVPWWDLRDKNIFEIVDLFKTFPQLPAPPELERQLIKERKHTASSGQRQHFWARLLRFLSHTDTPSVMRPWYPEGILVCHAEQLILLKLLCPKEAAMVVLCLDLQ